MFYEISKVQIRIRIKIKSGIRIRIKSFLISHNGLDSTKYRTMSRAFCGYSKLSVEESTMAQLSALSSQRRIYDENSVLPTAQNLFKVYVSFSTAAFNVGPHGSRRRIQDHDDLQSTQNLGPGSCIFTMVDGRY